MSLRRALLLTLALAPLACQSPGSQRIVGPDGSTMSHVHCGTDQAACFRMAGELCPAGYEMKPVLSSSAGNFLVRCRDTARTTTAACPAAPVVVVSRSTAPGASPNQSWPPSSEPWPLMYPWPPPETSANVRPVPTSRPDDLLDLGY
jgi:hypothetical protein